MRTRILLLIPCLALLASSIPAGDSAAREGAAIKARSAYEEALPPGVRQALGRAWSLLEQRDLALAQKELEAALALEGGKNVAETYYAMASLWWERRNALVALKWLDDAAEAKRGAYGAWMGGPGDEWDRRIEGRRRFIERNFTVVKLRFPEGRALPPLADPPPRDPLLREFAARLDKQVNDGNDEGVANLWVLLPNGSYWLGSELIIHGSGELDMLKARTWELAQDRAAARRAYVRRELAIEAGRSEGLQILEDRAREARAAEEHRQAVASLRPMTWTSVGPLDAPRVARELTEAWLLPTFRIRWLAVVEDEESVARFDFPKLDFSVHFDAGGMLRIKGKDKLNVALGSDWRTGLSTSPNQVDLVFDGRALRVTINGVEYGPVEVRKKDPPPGATEWAIEVMGDASGLRAFEVSKPPEEPLEAER